MSTHRTEEMLPLPTDWTPEQALAVYDVLTHFAEVIWQHYEDPLIALLQSEPEPHDEQPDLFDIDDPIPF